jgi:uncharacterized Zn finger protein (UPF0148 family)
MSAPGVTLERQVAEVRRELGMRRRKYPEWVAAARMTQAQADERLQAMEAVLATLEDLRKAQKLRDTPELF